MNDPEFQVGRLFQHQDGQVVIAEYSGCGGPDFAGAFPGIVEQVFQGLVGAVALRPDDPRVDNLVDDEDRENEGDLVCAAEKATAEVINFMVKYGRGLVCLPLTGAKCDELALHPQGSPIGIRVRSM
jgi:hypothetical protein